VLELARVMSGHEFDKSIIFVAFAGEEIGLGGVPPARKRRRKRV